MLSYQEIIERAAGAELVEAVEACNREVRDLATQVESAKWHRDQSDRYVELTEQAPAHLVADLEQAKVEQAEALTSLRAWRDQHVKAEQRLEVATSRRDEAAWAKGARRSASELAGLRKDRKAAKAVTDPLAPPFAIRKDDGLRFGIEIEVVNCDRSDVWQAIEAAGQADEGWEVVRDSSCSGYEAVSPPLPKRAIGAVLAVVRELQAMGAESDAVQECGIHVHVSHKTMNRRIDKIVKKAHEVAKSEWARVAETRESYCELLSDDFVDSLEGLSRDEILDRWYEEFEDENHDRTDKYHQSRYHAVNLHSLDTHGTVELRWFDGTLDESEISRAINLACTIIAAA